MVHKEDWRRESRPSLCLKYRLLGAAVRQFSNKVKERGCLRRGDFVICHEMRAPARTHSLLTNSLSAR